MRHLKHQAAFPSNSSTAPCLRQLFSDQSRPLPAAPGLPAETAAEVRAQLAALLAEPLQPKFSSKWFTGGAAAAVMAKVDPTAPETAKDRKRKKQQADAAAGGQQQQQQGGEGNKAVADPKTVQTINQAVALAQQRSDSRSKATADAAAKQQKRSKQAAAQPGEQQVPAGKKKQQAAAAGKKGKRAQDPRAAALQAALSKAVSAKQRKKEGGGRGMLVIPQALGRDAAGPDALQTLRRKLGVLT